jgi:hypothetical protein
MERSGLPCRSGLKLWGTRRLDGLVLIGCCIRLLIPVQNSTEALKSAFFQHQYVGKCGAL